MKTLKFYLHYTQKEKYSFPMCVEFLVISKGTQKELTCIIFSY